MTGASGVAVVAAALAAALLVPRARHPAVGRRRLEELARLRAGPGLTVALAGLAAVLLVTVEGLHLVLSLLVLLAVWASVVLLRRARMQQSAARRQALVVAVCEALVGELRAGQPLGASLEHCREVWPAFEPVVAASRLGADVPAALRRLSEQPGATGLREVAAAWQVSESSGSGLAAALAQVAATAREREATRHLVRGELASAQATARLVAALPLASLAMSAGIGAHPWHFLLGTPAGLGCLGVGAAFAFLGLLWIDRIAAGVLAG